MNQEPEVKYYDITRWIEKLDIVLKQITERLTKIESKQAETNIKVGEQTNKLGAVSNEVANLELGVQKLIRDLNKFTEDWQQPKEPTPTSIG